MKMLVTLLLGCYALFGTTSYALAPEEPIVTLPDAEVLKADFGLFNTDDAGEQKFTSTSTVPLIVGQDYGWVILLRTSKSKVKVKEEFTLPSKPDTWGAPEDFSSQTFSVDGRTSTLENEVPTAAGLISNSWEVEPGDPKGHYVIRVFIDGSLASTFEFEVQ